MRLRSERENLQPQVANFYLDYKSILSVIIMYNDIFKALLKNTEVLILDTRYIREGVVRWDVEWQGEAGVARHGRCGVVWRGVMTHY